MAFGVFVATFSSIYVAGPLLMYMETRFPRQASEAAGRAVRVGTEDTAKVAPTRTRGGMRPSMPPRSL